MHDSAISGGNGYALAVHGGAGTLMRGDMSAGRAAVYRAGLTRALAAGRDVLAHGGGALDAVTQAVCALEDDPLFNAGRGAVFTRAGDQEMDAAVMDGRNRSAGAVAGIFGPKNPILAARAVMERSPHVLLVGKGAMALCREAGLAFADRDYFLPRRAGERLPRRSDGSAPGGSMRTNRVVTVQSARWRVIAPEISRQRLRPEG
jgi:L-asparaginase / beta-aspartyl-peptidase